MQTSLTASRVVFVLVDGLGDVALAEEASTATPLQLAGLTTMDLLARAGINGLLDPVEPGLACGSDTAHMSILGYHPRSNYRGRGAFESMGAGLDMLPGDIAFKSNFASIDIARRHVITRRADRNFEDLGPVLCNALDGITLDGYPDYQVAIKYATEHSCPLRKCEPKDTTAEAAITAQLVNNLSDRFIHELENHPTNHQRVQRGKLPANCILLRGCGSCIDVPSFKERHDLRAFMIAPTCIIAGLGQTIKMDIKKVNGATGDYHSNLLSKAEAAVHFITSGEYDFGFVHVKAVDDAGHDRDLEKKIYFLEKIDEMIQSMIQQLLIQDKQIQYTFVLTGDHTTPLSKGDHTCEPVPFVMAHLHDIVDIMSNPIHSTKWDSVCHFDEIAAARGHLGRFCGDQVMDMVKQFRMC